MLGVDGKVGLPFVSEAEFLDLLPSIWMSTFKCKTHAVESVILRRAAAMRP